MIRMRLGTMLMLIAPLAGCGRMTSYQPSLDHPANPAATAARESAPSTTLSTAQDDSADGAVEAGPRPEAQHHAGAGEHGGGGPRAATAPPTGQSDEAAGGYTCPMHPDVRSDRPGVCPECGMKLEQSASDR